MNLKSTCGSVLTACMGRQSLARAGRWLTNTARLDCANDMCTNGEVLVQEVVLSSYPRDRALVVFDVGANVGDWSAQLLARCDKFSRQRCSLHAFEPVSSTMATLQRRLGTLASGRDVITVPMGMSDKEGHCDIAVVEEECGVNAIAPDPRQKLKRTEVISLATVDGYCEQAGITEIALLKSDAEGHDLFVLRGAHRMLNRKSIAVVQFEYNFRWVWSRALLLDVFELAAAAGYHVGKVTPRGIEFYSQWDEELEKFVEGNYLLCREDWVEKFPSVRWWKETA